MPAMPFDQLRSTLSDLLRLFQQRQREDEGFARLAAREKATCREAKKALRLCRRQREAELAALDGAYQQEVEEIRAWHACAEEKQNATFTERLARLDEETQQTEARLQAELKDALWLADSLLEAGQKRIQEQQEALRRDLAEADERGGQLQAELQPLLRRFSLDAEELLPGPEDVPVVPGDSPADVRALLHKGRELVHEAQQMRLLGWLGWAMQLAVALWLVVLCLAPALLLQPRVVWLPVGLGVAFGAVLLERFVLVSIATRRLRQAGEELAVLRLQAKRLGEELLQRGAASARQERARVQRQHATDRKRASARLHPQLDRLDLDSRSARTALEQQASAEREALARRQARDLKEARRRCRKARKELAAAQDQTLKQTRASYAAKVRAIRKERADAEERLRSGWESGCQHFLSSVGQLAQLRGEAGSGSNKGSPASLALGSLRLDLARLGEEFHISRLDPLPAGPVEVPAFLPFPRRSALVVQGDGPEKAETVGALQSLMLDFLTTLPPGKVRFTILDPVGLGDNFAAFMHLADHDDALVSGRIWTEAAHIEKQLADLTQHIENVIQKYLRSEFGSIEDYNDKAGEVAEPYRVLVVASFPVNFTPQAARRLVSIVQSGARCGVYALIGADPRQPLPQGFQMEELTGTPSAFCLRWQGERLVSGIPELDRFPLALPAPPERNQLIAVVRSVGAQARDASRVEVPFSFVAPAEKEIWKGDSKRGLAVPLGRAGAVRQLVLRLGEGTSQHVLVAGKTGSGKSTLWHALIVNLVLRYSPDEVELYLIDFKKGVEFKPYAELALPHARVIAIEGEREFGLSVLQRLDGLLRERGDIFRAAGVNDLGSFRQERPEERCPRILLIVDEFQEFFVEDDRLAQEAALLLDRLVRQGRAFGLHVLLGSQTLGGAYSLARSTLDQMAVRIALQCSEADAQFILGKDNTAARLLSRPGEAVYNDAAGALEGNEIFQVVWLSDEQREQALREVRSRAEQAPGLPPAPPLVFESTAPAELERNTLLRQVVEGGSFSRGARRAWLGDAIAIKDHTAAVFQRRTGSNLLVVGQNEEAARAVLASALVSLAVQHEPGEASFVLLDGTAGDEPGAGFLSEVAEGWPHPAEVVERGALAGNLAQLVEVVNQRLKGAPATSACYLLIHGLQRFREFRRGDDDLGFSRRGAERAVSPLEQLQALLRDGPGVGIHTLVWCDLLVNLSRTLDRQGLRECGLRVLFQMGAADSSQLLDSPVASKLGRNRALFSHDEMAQPEKFRPYGLPALAWLAEVKGQLGRKQEMAVR